MSKIKVLTVQFDVTHLSSDAIDILKTNLESQGEFDLDTDEYIGADILNSGVREVDTEDV